ncbi:type III PLP-dependent enzyme [Micromonospora sp. B11E3]|uniref:type III PLP-dependent enzyme n=1 Tax=Micromonospora sp. B11E3 TaxID=3153562 RepID=UPI00325E49F0
MNRPTYLYDLDALGTHAAAIRAALPSRVELLYAMKANPAPELLRTLAPHVDGFEAASAGELHHLTRTLPGVRPAVLGGPGKTDPELTAGLAAGVHRFHVESPHELRRLSALATAAGSTADVLLRVNLPVNLDGAALVMGGAPTPFGMDPEQARDCVRLDLPGIRIHGVHAHLASGLTAPAAAMVARRIVDWAVSQLGAHEVNIGGGMAVDYTDPANIFDWTRYGGDLQTLLAEHPDLVLRIEPGRAVTAYCGWYLTEVIDVKRSHDEWFVVVAGGTHHLRTPAAKGHSQPFLHLPRTDWTHPYPRPRTGDGPVTIVGQLCTPKDVLARTVGTNTVSAGDVIAFAMAGAYAWNISHHDFLMHEPPSFTVGNLKELADV